jgi:UTP--glucose-1-phosphate uridylyltransferase
MEYTGYGATPKPFVTVGGKTVFGLIMEEARAAGIQHVGMIVSNEEAQELYGRFFDPFADKPDILAAIAKKTPAVLEALEELKEFDLHFYFQREPLGFGHAVGKGTPILEEDSFDGCLVALGDDLVAGGPPAMAQLIDVHQKTGGMIVMVDEVTREEAKSFGVAQVAAPMSLESKARVAFPVTEVVEKPADPQANLIDGEERYFAIVGRYLLEAEDLEFLAAQNPTPGKELDFTPLFERNIAKGRLTAVLPNGEFLTVGNAFEQQKAGLRMALEGFVQRGETDLLSFALQSLQRIGVLEEEGEGVRLKPELAGLVRGGEKN